MKNPHIGHGALLTTMIIAVCPACIAACMVGCTGGILGNNGPDSLQQPALESTTLDASDMQLSEEELAALESQRAAEEAAAQAEAARIAAEKAADERAQDASAIRSSMRITEDMRQGFVHGPKTAEHQKYIVLHDTEGEGSAAGVVNWWDSNGQYVAAHFIINKDGTIVQCAPLDAIVHHAGFGDTGHNAKYGVTDESRDDKRGTVPIGSWAADYGMNSYSIGIEMVHVGGSGGYPEAQLAALDSLIAYIDAYYGFESQIIDHKAWRTGNSDTSAEFAPYFASYQLKRKHV